MFYDNSNLLPSSQLSQAFKTEGTDQAECKASLEFAADGVTVGAELYAKTVTEEQCYVVLDLLGLGAEAPSTPSYEAGTTGPPSPVPAQLR